MKLKKKSHSLVSVKTQREYQETEEVYESQSSRLRTVL